MNKKIVGLICFSTMFIIGISAQSFASKVEENNEQTVDQVKVSDIKDVERMQRLSKLMIPIIKFQTILQI